MDDPWTASFEVAWIVLRSTRIRADADADANADNSCFQSLCEQTFTSITGFRAHLKSRQRAGQISSETASKATPVEVKVLDSYLTVADTRKAKGPGSPAGGWCSRLLRRGIC